MESQARCRLAVHMEEPRPGLVERPAAGSRARAHGERHRTDRGSMGVRAHWAATLDSAEEAVKAPNSR